MQAPQLSFDTTRPASGRLACTVAKQGDAAGLLLDRIRLLEAVIENFPGGISLFDDDHRMLVCNRQQRELLEYPDDLVKPGQTTLEDLFRFNAERGEYGPGAVEDHVARRMSLVRERRAHVYDRTRPNGTIVEVRGMPLEGGGFVTTYLDVTEQRKNQQLVAHMAHHDPLTNLPNRMLFNDRLQNAIALAKRGVLMAVHYLDIDGFKPVNDSHGHQAGDELLVAIAERMRAIVREHDTVARLGGDEFAVVQTAIKAAEDSAVLARRILAAFERPFQLTRREIRVGVSIGIALAPQDGLTADELLWKADAALYRCKANGRRQFSFHAA